LDRDGDYKNPRQDRLWHIKPRSGLARRLQVAAGREFSAAGIQASAFGNGGGTPKSENPLPFNGLTDSIEVKP
jgi:hypothetical protein